MPASETKNKLQKDLQTLKIGFNDAKQKYIHMEQSKNRMSQRLSEKSAGARSGARKAALGDDGYIKDTSINSLGTLNKQERQLNRIIADGYQAGQDLQEAN